MSAGHVALNQIGQKGIQKGRIQRGGAHTGDGSPATRAASHGRSMRRSGGGGVRAAVVRDEDAGRQLEHVIHRLASKMTPPCSIDTTHEGANSGTLTSPTSTMSMSIDSIREEATVGPPAPADFSPEMLSARNTEEELFVTPEVQELTKVAALPLPRHRRSSFVSSSPSAPRRRHSARSTEEEPQQRSLDVVDPPPAGWQWVLGPFDTDSDPSALWNTVCSY